MSCCKGLYCAKAHLHASTGLPLGMTWCFSSISLVLSLSTRQARQIGRQHKCSPLLKIQAHKKLHQLRACSHLSSFSLQISMLLCLPWPPLPLSGFPLPPDLSARVSQPLSGDRPSGLAAICRLFLSACARPGPSVHAGFFMRLRSDGI